ncbi:fumarylacetoacetate hydrolase family protein [Desertibaculum subflavum]|uniref:fumarylacetoacetate hydrolase family protein n=1 Tax=Desertibaculum subflavum TaxID=2268458 RepID=UPI000E6750B8
MRFASFQIAGRPTYGVIDPAMIGGAHLRDLGHVLGDAYPDLKTLIASGRAGRIAAEQLAGAPRYALDAVSLLPPIPNPDKIVCIGLNYAKHAAEGGMKIPTHPSLFLRLNNTLVAHGGALVRPKASGDMDYEGELAVVIGEPGRHIDRARALDHVFGYACFNDGSIRDFQFQHSVAVGKNFHATGGFGPWIASAEEVGDPAQLTLVTRVNGAEMQRGETSDLIFDVPAIIAYVSTFTPLAAGDVISTGTPAGVGFARKPPVWLKAGDTVEVEIDRIGVLRNTIAAEG